MNSNIIASDFIHGKNFNIGAFTIIEKGCKVGDNVTIESYTILHKNTVVANDTFIGSYCEIGENLSIGSNVIIQGRNRTGNFCRIDDNVTIKYGAILTSKVLLKKNAFLGPNVITLGSTHKREEVHGTIIGENSYIGAGSKIAGGVKISDNITVGAISFVNKDLTTEGIYVGIPAKIIK
jgi:UDP-3-O-[3-hydroxymyristoyl] glucosamine N-acyltransferase